MKRLVLSAVALSLLALPVAEAQAGPRHEPPRYERYNSQWEKPGYDKPHQKKWKHRWERGHSVPAWQRKHVVKDYHRYGLRRPGHGQHWVKVDNDFLLISIASGLIGGIIASQY